MKTERRKTRVVKVGNIRMGSPFPVSVQAMTKVATSSKKELFSEISSLVKAGAEIIRFAITDRKETLIIPALKKKFTVPFVADIHFDYKLALYSIEAGIDKIRLNPGNVKRSRLKEVLKKAGEQKIPVRLGFNSGSVPFSGNVAGDMVSFANDTIRYCEDSGFSDFVISLKTPFVSATIDAYRKLAGLCDYPFHLGITEAGTGKLAAAKSVLGIGILLAEGIGDTIRVSLTEQSVEEVKWAQAILQSLDLRVFEPEIISCPTCGRCKVPLYKMVSGFSGKIQAFAKKYPELKKMKIALMGCSVNGPGEARQADIGIAGGKGAFALFEKGKIIGTWPQNKIEKIFFERLKDLVSN